MLQLVFNNRKLPYKTTCINSTSITQPTLSFYLRKPVEFATFTQTVMTTTLLLVTGTESSLNIE